jgi:hypothetical protein
VVASALLLATVLAANAVRLGDYGSGSPIRTLAALMGLAVAWLALNGPLEGAVLLRVSGDHGLTLGDLLVLPAVVVAAAVAARDL